MGPASVRPLLNAPSFHYFKTSQEFIRLAVMTYIRFWLSLRNMENLLRERGIDICHETVRFWWNRLSQKSPKSAASALQSSGRTTPPAERGSATHLVRQSAMPRRHSLSRSASTSAPEESLPPSKRAMMGLPQTGDRPGNAGVDSTLAGMAPKSIGLRSRNRILRPIRELRHVR